MTTTDPTVPSTAPQPAPLDLDAIEARCDAATRGPWWAWDRGVGWCIALDKPDDEGNPTDYLPDGMRTDIGRRGDAQFIAHARQDVPRLVAEVRRLRAELERWRTGRRWHSLPPVPAVPDAIPHAAAMIRAASDDELPEPVADLLRSGAQRLKSAADAYGIVAAKLAEATADRLTGAGHTYETVIARLRAELDRTEAARANLQRNAEMLADELVLGTGEMTTEQGDGFRRERAILRWAADRLDPGSPVDWCDSEDFEVLQAQAEVARLVRRWADELDAAPAAPCCTQRAGYECDEHPGPLSTVPPAGTEGDRG